MILTNIVIVTRTQGNQKQLSVQCKPSRLKLAVVLTFKYKIEFKFL
jgi:hypothetical protein